MPPQRPTGTGKPKFDPKRGRRPQGGRRNDRPEPETNPVLYGIHTIAAALANPDREIQRLWLTENAERRLVEALRDRDIPIERASPKDLDRRLGSDTVHQGAAAEVAPLPDRTLNLDNQGDGPAQDLFLVLDQVTDPHNVGAVLRSAAVFGATGLIMPRRHSPPIGGTLAKAASGATEIVPVYLVQNLGDTLVRLSEAHFRIIGLDGEAPDLIEAAPMTGPIALVLGAEGKGLRQRTRECCDQLCRIGTAPSLASLNVSNAAAVALHVAAMHRRTNSIED